MNNVKEFVTSRKAAPGKYSYALVRHRHHLAFRRRDRAACRPARKMLHVPYKGSAPAMTDLIGGQMPFARRHRLGRDPAAQDRQDQGHRRDHRQALCAAARDVPTFAESGYPDVDADTWLVIVAPRGLPPRRQGAAGEGAGQDRGRRRRCTSSWSRRRPEPRRLAARRRALIEQGAAADARHRAARQHHGGLSSADLPCATKPRRNLRRRAASPDRRTATLAGRAAGGLHRAHRSGQPLRQRRHRHLLRTRA